MTDQKHDPELLARVQALIDQTIQQNAMLIASQTGMGRADALVAIGSRMIDAMHQMAPEATHTLVSCRLMMNDVQADPKHTAEAFQKAVEGYLGACEMFQRELEANANGAKH